MTMMMMMVMVMIMAYSEMAFQNSHPSAIPARSNVRVAPNMFHHITSYFNILTYILSIHRRARTSQPMTSITTLRTLSQTPKDSTLSKYIRTLYEQDPSRPWMYSRKQPRPDYVRMIAGPKMCRRQSDPH